MYGPQVAAQKPHRGVEPLHRTSKVDQQQVQRVVQTHVRTLVCKDRRAVLPKVPLRDHDIAAPAYGRDILIHTHERRAVIEPLAAAAAHKSVQPDDRAHRNKYNGRNPGQIYHDSNLPPRYLHPVRRLDSLRDRGLYGRHTLCRCVTRQYILFCQG